MQFYALVCRCGIRAHFVFSASGQIVPMQANATRSVALPLWLQKGAEQSLDCPGAGKQESAAPRPIKPALENKKAEYHQQTFSDPLMILRLVRVAGFEPTASWTRTMRATNCATPGKALVYYTTLVVRLQVYFCFFGRGKTAAISRCLSAHCYITKGE